MGELVNIDSLKDLEAWGEFATKAGLIPQGTTGHQAMAIIQAGKEMGLQPLQALRSMSFIRGRLTMSVQAQLALARQKCNVQIKTLSESNGMCEVLLCRGEEQVPCKYTLDDAKKAGLYRADGAYDKYPRQMLRWRAIGDALRLIAPDLVLNLLSPEEAESIEPQTKETEASQKAREKATELTEKLAKLKEKPAEVEAVNPEPSDFISTAERNELWEKVVGKKIPRETVLRYLKNFHNIDSFQKITKSHLPEIEGWIEKWQLTEGK